MCRSPPRFAPAVPPRRRPPHPSNYRSPHPRTDRIAATPPRQTAPHNRRRRHRPIDSESAPPHRLRTAALHRRRRTAAPPPPHRRTAAPPHRTAAAAPPHRRTAAPPHRLSVRTAAAAPPHRRTAAPPHRLRNAAAPPSSQPPPLQPMSAAATTSSDSLSDTDVDFLQNSRAGSAPPAPSDAAPASGDDSDFVPPAHDDRHRVRRPQIRTIARRCGISVDDLSLLWLIKQHGLGCCDDVFLRAGRSSTTESPDDIGYPPPTRWKALREAITSPYLIRPLLPLVNPSNPIGLQVAGYAAVAAGVANIGGLLSYLIPRMRDISLIRRVTSRRDRAACDSAAQWPLLPVCLAGDGIAGVGFGSSGQLAGGKVYSMYVKPLGLEYAQQGPLSAIPVSVVLGSDSSARLARVWSEWRLAEIVRHLHRAPVRLSLDPHDPPLARLFFIFMGDFPAACAAIQLSPQNRPFPTATGYINRWFSEPCCWRCGGAPADIYNPDSAAVGTRFSARLQTIETRIGLPPMFVFYAPVHAIAQVAVALIADIGRSYKLFHGFAHPVVAAIATLFPGDGWDPFRVKKVDPTSKKPGVAAEPASVFSFLLDEGVHRRFVELLLAHPFTFTVVSADSPNPLVVRIPSIWSCFCRWFNACVLGDADVLETQSITLRRAWLLLNERTTPISPDVRRRLVGPRPPRFDNRFTGFGPAAHLALCGMHDLVRQATYLMPRAAARDERLRVDGFLHTFAEVWLEHRQKRLRRTCTRFSITDTSRNLRAAELLRRLIEENIVRVAGSASDPSPSSDDGEQPVSKRFCRSSSRSARANTNRAYRSIPLSRTIDISLIEQLDATAVEAAASPGTT